MKLPGSERSIGTDTTGDLDQPGRTEIGPGKFFLAGPDEFNRLASRFGETRGFECCVAGVLAAVGRSGIWYDDAHLVFRQVKRLRQFRPNAKRTLCAGPDRERIA